MTVYITEVEFDYGGTLSEVRVKYHMMNGCVVNEAASGPHQLMLSIAKIFHEAFSVRAGYEGPSIYEMVSGRAPPMTDTATVVEDQPALPGAPLMIEDKR